MLPRIPGSPVVVSPMRTGGIIGIGDGIWNSDGSGETTRLYTSRNINNSLDAQPAADAASLGVTTTPSLSTTTTTSTTTTRATNGGGWRSWWWNNDSNDGPSDHHRHHSAASLDDDVPSNIDTHPLSYGTVQADTAEEEQEEEIDHNHDDGDDDHEEDGDEHHDTIALLTRRLRCLFGIVTLPIVPLGTLSCLALVWMLYTAFVLDGTTGVSCAQPLHFYAYVSLVFLVYAPNHARIRTFILLHVFQDYNTNYTNIRASRDNSNTTTTATRTPRPASVRRYDQIFHTIALFYVYGGITLISACGDNVDDLSSANSHLVDNATTTTSSSTEEESGGGISGGGNRLLSFLNDGSHDSIGSISSISISSSSHSYYNYNHQHPHKNDNGDYDSNMGADDSMMMYNDAMNNNACQATCPHLYPALRVYVTTLEMFTFSLILPLLFLPCLYLYFIRRTMADAEALAVLQERLRDEEALRRNGGVTTDEIMSHLEEVQLYIVTENYDANSTTGEIVVVSKQQGQSPRKDTEKTSDSANNNDDNDTTLQQEQQPTRQYPECRSKECCICMENFTLHHGYSNSSDDDELLTRNSDNDDNSHEENNDDIETGYSSFESMSSSSSSPTNAEATQLIPQHDQPQQSSSSRRRTTSLRSCLRTSRISNANNSNSHVVVRGVKCGHLFHKRCIASWVGGRWEMDSATTTTTTTTTNAGREESATSSSSPPPSSRRARRTTCPLCRQDLRPDR